MWKNVLLCALAIVVVLVLLAYLAPSYAPQKLVDILPKMGDSEPAAFTNKRYGVGTFEERFMPSRGTLLHPAAGY